MTYDELYAQAEVIGQKLDMLPQNDPRRKQLQDQMGAITSQMQAAQAPGVRTPEAPAAPVPVPAPAPQVPAGAAYADEPPAPVGPPQPSTVPNTLPPEDEAMEDFILSDEASAADPDNEMMDDFTLTGDDETDPTIANSRQWTVLGKDRSEFAPAAQAAMDTGFDIASGFNKRIAQLAGVGLDTMDAALRVMAEDGFLETPGGGAQAMQRAFAKIGMTTSAPDTVSREVGSALFDNLALLSAAFMAAPTIAAAGAQQGAGAIKQAAGSMASSLRANPAVGVASEVGASIGGAVGEEQGGAFGGMAGAMLGGGLGGSTLGRATAGMAGGVAGAAPAALAGTAALGPIGGIGMGAAGWSIGKRAGKAVSERLLTRRGAPTKPIISNDPPQVAAAYAQDAIAGLRAQADEDIRGAIEYVGGVNDPQRAARLFHRAIDNAYKRSQARANQLWNKVDKNRPVSALGSQKLADSIVAETGRFGDEALPGDIIAKINALADKKVGPEWLGQPGEEYLEQNGTIKDLLDIRSSIELQLREGPDHDGLKRNLKRLSESLMDDIVNEFPGDRDLRAARDFSRWLHDQFSRGPVGQFFGKNAPKGQVLNHPTKQALQALMAERTGDQLKSIHETIDAPSLSRTMQAMVQAKFQEVAATMDPEAARKFMESPDLNRTMRAFPTVAVKHAQATQDLADALANKALIEKSAFTRFADEDIQTAMNSMLNGAKKLDRAREIKRGLEKADPSGEAMRALQTGLVQRLFELGGSRPQAMVHLLESRDFQPLYMEILGAEKMFRLKRILDSGVALQAGGPKSPQQRALSLVARYLGAGAARSAGATTIQQTGTAATLTELMFNSISGRMHLPELVSRAVVDPKVERYLYRQIPSNIREIQQDADAVRSLASAIAGVRYVPELPSEDE